MHKLHYLHQHPSESLANFHKWFDSQVEMTVSMWGPLIPQNMKSFYVNVRSPIVTILVNRWSIDRLIAFLLWRTLVRSVVPIDAPVLHVVVDRLIIVVSQSPFASVVDSWVQ